jgi:CRP-like cAMP-binding protein
MDHRQNFLLTRLAPKTAAIIEQQAMIVEMPQAENLHEVGQPIGWVYFPLTGLISCVAADEVRGRYEIGIIGPEGMTGMPILLGTDCQPMRSIVQIPGHAVRISKSALEDLVDGDRQFRTILLRFCQAQFVQVAYTAISNSRDRVDARLARWILMCRDRTGNDELNLTHEFLSIMLGVRRAGVTNALHILEGEHAIRSTRACISIRDRARLAELAGDAYGVAEREYERLLGRPASFD